MHKNPKILVYAPIHKVKNYVLQEWANHVKKLTYPNKEILLIDNSPERMFSVQFQKKTGITTKWFHKKGFKSQQHIAACNEIARHYAIRNKFDYIFSYECDQFGPHTIIESLLKHHKKVVSGIYFIDIGADSKLMIQKLTGTIHSVSRNISTKESFYFVNGRLKKVYNPGMGAMLIHKSVFSKIPFRSVPGQSSHPDSWFAYDCFRANIPIFADTSMFLNHKNQSWSNPKLYKL